jgi:hypothetical protein
VFSAGISILPTVKLFISWSGSRSHQIARILRESLPNVLPHVEPWFSSEDIAKGTRWSIELGKELDAAKPNHLSRPREPARGLGDLRGRRDVAVD